MLAKEKLERINALSKKAKTSGLTKKETAEQQQLRQEYLQTFRQTFKQQLHSVTVVDEEGNDVTPNALKESKGRNDLIH